MHCAVLLRHISTAGHMKITDFGLAKTKEIGSSAGSTQGGMKGTVAYVAPEILMTYTGAPVYSQATDMYAFAVLINEVLTRAVPYAGLVQQQIFGLLYRPPAGTARPDLYAADLPALNTCGDGLTLEL